MAANAAGWVVLTIVTLGLPVDWVLIALGFLLALGFYNRDRLDRTGFAADRLTMPDRTGWVQDHTARLRTLVRASFMASVLLVALRPATILPLLAGLGFALTYTIRWIPWRGHRLAWKQIPGLKMPFVAILWTVTTVITPAAVYGQLGRATTWLLAGAVCMLVMVQILLNDLRDVEGDRQHNIHSIPVIFGDTVARSVGFALVLVAVGLMVSTNPVPFLLTGGYSGWLVWHYQRQSDQRWRIWIEGQGIFAGLVALLIQPLRY